MLGAIGAPPMALNLESLFGEFDPRISENVKGRYILNGPALIGKVEHM